MAFEKSVLSIVAYGLLSQLRYLYHFYYSRAARAWSFCNKMYHIVFRYEYLTFQTQICLHKQYIFDTNIIQSEYALLFPFSIHLHLFSALLLYLHEIDRTSVTKVTQILGNIYKQK